MKQLEISPSIALKPCSHFELVDNISNQMLNKLGLDGYACVQIADNSKLATFKNYLTEIEKVDNFSTIINYTKYICWVKPILKTCAPIASTTFYQLPYFTFISNAALRAIAPIYVFPAEYSYALLENLYHESLHQKLISIIRSANNHFFVNTIAAQNIKIYIPWRVTHWSLEHVLHAAYVYIHLVATRRVQLKSEKNGEHIQVLVQSIQGSLKLLDYLVNSLSQYKSIFSANGRKLIDSILNSFYSIKIKEVEDEVSQKN